jgi:hypothetical protein
VRATTLLAGPLLQLLLLLLLRLLLLLLVLAAPASLLSLLLLLPVPLLLLPVPLLLLPVPLLLPVLLPVLLPWPRLCPLLLLLLVPLRSGRPLLLLPLVLLLLPLLRLPLLLLARLPALLLLSRLLAKLVHLILEMPHLSRQRDSGRGGRVVHRGEPHSVGLLHQEASPIVVGNGKHAFGVLHDIAQESRRRCRGVCRDPDTHVAVKGLREAPDVMFDGGCLARRLLEVRRGS